MTKKDLFLEEARLGPRNAVLVGYDEAPTHTAEPATGTVLRAVDLAHVVMLVETGILDPAAADGSSADSWRSKLSGPRVSLEPPLRLVSRPGRAS